MKRFLILLLVFMLFLLGCNDQINRTLTFTGESSSWNADYVEKVAETWAKDSSGEMHYSNSASKRLNLKYKGSDISNVALVKYSYEAGLSRGSGEATMDKNGYVMTGYSGGKNVALIKSDDVIVVTVEWNGLKETIRLTNK